MVTAGTALVVFAALFALDFVWARYTNAITAQRELAASLYAAALIILSGIAAVVYTTEPLMLVPAALGAFAGTYVAVKWGST